MEFTEEEKKVFSKMGKVGGKIGGATTKQRHGHDFYVNIGRKGGLSKKKPLDLTPLTTKTELL